MQASMDTPSPQEQKVDAVRFDDGHASNSMDERTTAKELVQDFSSAASIADEEEMPSGGDTMCTEVEPPKKATTSSEVQGVEVSQLNDTQAVSFTPEDNSEKSLVQEDKSLVVLTNAGESLAQKGPQNNQSIVEGESEVLLKVESLSDGQLDKTLEEVGIENVATEEKEESSPQIIGAETTSNVGNVDGNVAILSQQESNLAGEIEAQHHDDSAKFTVPAVGENVLANVEGFVPDTMDQREQNAEVKVSHDADVVGAEEIKHVVPTLPSATPSNRTSGDTTERDKCEIIEVVKVIISEAEASVSLGDTKSCGDECDGDLDSTVSQVHLQNEEVGVSSEESFQEASRLDRDASSSLDSTANTNTPRPTRDDSSSVEQPSAVEEGNSSSGEDCVSSKARFVPHPGRQRTKRIDLRHQFVREIVKIQQDRDQYEKQWQAAQQGGPSSSGGNTPRNAAGTHSQERQEGMRGSDIPSRKQTGKESARFVAQESIPMREGVAPDTVSMAWGRAPERQRRGVFSGPGGGAQHLSTILKSKVGIHAQSGKDASDRGASQPSKVLRKEDFFQNGSSQRGRETSNRQQRFAPVYRPPSARDTDDLDESEGLQEEVTVGLHHLAVTGRLTNPPLPSGINTPLSPAPAGFPQFRGGGLAGGPRALKEKGTPFSMASAVSATPSDRSTWLTEPQGIASTARDSIGLKVTIDTANQQRHIEYSKPLPVSEREGDSIVVTVSEHGRSSRVVNSYNAPHSGLGSSRSNQQPESGPGAPGSGFLKGIQFGVPGDASGFQFRATPPASNGAGILGKGGVPLSNVDRSKDRKTAVIKNRYREPAMRDVPHVRTHSSLKFSPSANLERATVTEQMTSTRDLIKAVERLHVEPKGRAIATPQVDAQRPDGFKGGMTQRMSDTRLSPVSLSESAHPVPAHQKWGDMEDSPELGDSSPLDNHLSNWRIGGSPIISDTSESASGYSRRRALSGKGQDGETSSFQNSGPGPIRGHRSHRNTGPWRREGGESDAHNQYNKVAFGVGPSNPTQPIAPVASTPLKKSVWERLGPSIESSSIAHHTLINDHVGGLPEAIVSQDVRMLKPHAQRSPEARPLVVDPFEGINETDTQSNGEYGDSSLSRDLKQKRSKFELYVPRRSTPGS